MTQNIQEENQPSLGAQMGIISFDLTNPTNLREFLYNELKEPLRYEGDNIVSEKHLCFLNEANFEIELQNVDAIWDGQKYCLIGTIRGDYYQRKYILDLSRIKALYIRDILIDCSETFPSLIVWDPYTGSYEDMYKLNESTHIEDANREG